MAETVAKAAMKSSAAVESPAAVKSTPAPHAHRCGRRRGSGGSRDGERRRREHPRELVFDEPTHSRILLDRNARSRLSRLQAIAYKIVSAPGCGRRAKQNKDKFTLRNSFLCFHA
jgi:hypothetical protein